MALRYSRSAILEESVSSGGDEDDKEKKGFSATTTAISNASLSHHQSNNNSYQITLEFDDQSSLKRVRVKQQDVVNRQGPVVNVRQLNSTEPGGTDKVIEVPKRLKNKTINYKKRRSRDMASRRSSASLNSPTNGSVSSSSSSSYDGHAATTASADRKLNRLQQRINKIKSLVSDLKQHQFTNATAPSTSYHNQTSYTTKYYHKMYKLIESFLHIRHSDTTESDHTDQALFEQFKVLCGPFMDWCEENKFDRKEVAIGGDTSSRLVQVNLSTTSRKSDSSRVHNSEDGADEKGVVGSNRAVVSSSIRKSMSPGHLSQSDGEEKESRAVRNHFVTLDVSDMSVQQKSFTVNNSTPKDQDFPIYKSEAKSNELNHLKKENKRLEEKLETMNEEFRSLKKKIKAKNKVITRSDYESLIDQLNALKEETKTLRGRVQDLESENYQLKQMNVAGDDSGLDQYSASSGGNTLHLNDYSMFSERTLDQDDDDAHGTNLTLQNLF